MNLKVSRRKTGRTYQSIVKNYRDKNINMVEQLAQGADDRKNFGYAAILKIYHELGLHRFFNNKARNKDFEHNTNSIMILLVISRLLSPGSKKKAF